MNRFASAFIKVSFAPARKPPTQWEHRPTEQPWNEKNEAMEDLSQNVRGVFQRASTLRKQAGLGNFARGAMHTAGEAAGGARRWLTGKAIVPALGANPVGKDALKSAIQAATSAGNVEQAKHLTNVLDATRFKQLAAWGGAAALGVQAAKGAKAAIQKRQEYMDQTYGPDYSV